MYVNMYEGTYVEGKCVYIARNDDTAAIPGRGRCTGDDYVRQVRWY